MAKTCLFICVSLSTRLSGLLVWLSGWTGSSFEDDNYTAITSDYILEYDVTLSDPAFPRFKFVFNDIVRLAKVKRIKPKKNSKFYDVVMVMKKL